MAKNQMVAGAGLEPTTSGLWARRATKLLHPALYDKNLKVMIGSHAQDINIRSFIEHVNIY